MKSARPLSQEVAGQEGSTDLQTQNLLFLLLDQQSIHTSSGPRLIHTAGEVTSYGGLKIYLQSLGYPTTREVELNSPAFACGLGSVTHL